MTEFSSNFIVMIPARYASTRLPGKPLLKIGDKSLIRHVCDKALMSQADQVIVATDDHRIAEHLEDSAVTVVMTSKDCQSGSDRIAQASSTLNIPDDTVIVNLQGDEPFMPPTVIDCIAGALHANPGVHMSTGCERLADEQAWESPDIVKVTRDKNQMALYFSRSLIPYSVEHRYQTVFKHLGIYAYTAGYLKTFAKLDPCQLEKSEKLEQLRVLYNGDQIIVCEITQPTGIGVDTPADLAAAREIHRQGLRS